MLHPDHAMPLREDLLAPGAYPLPAPTRVDLEETHVSWVFLLDRDVYKVKRPLDLGFLDFSTLARRRAACEAEVELNRRLAPDVYFGIVPVRLDAHGKHTLVGDGAVVDWAVHMRRLPDARRADVLAARWALDVQAVDDLAIAIARFHEGAPHGEAASRFGSVEAVTRNAEENFAATAQVIGRYLSEAEAAELLAWQRRALIERAPLIAARAAAGRVRDGHGDLRLEHVYLEHGQTGPTIIDCIEFADRYRIADVCADIAFLSMDLAEHGRVDLGERLLATYARESNDFDLYELVDFYSSYRAFVRAKVSSILADDAAALDEPRRKADREARRSFVLALSAGRRPLLGPSLVAVGGVIASGKSTIADLVASELSAPVIEADRTRKSMVGVAPTEHLRDGAFQGAYDLGFSERVYAEVLRRADVVLASGRPVIVDASFRSAAARLAARDLAKKHGVPFHLVECKVPLELSRARLVEREKHDAVSDGRLAVFEDFCRSFEPMTELDEEEHVVLDTSLPIDASLSTLRRVLDAWPRGLWG